MEVHSHTSTARKKWTHYLWEFLMLFLAVFCGFLAENKRENIVESHRAREYAKSIIEDLRKDRLEIDGMLEESIQVISAFDSLQKKIHLGIKNHEVPGNFYYYSRIGSIVPIVTWNDAAFIQVIQSGNLRYFRNTEITKKISYYYACTQEIDGQHETDRTFRAKSVEIRNRLLNNYYYTRYSHFNIDRKSIADSLFTKLIPLQQNDPNLLNEYANSFENRRATLRNLITMHFPRALKTSEDLIYLLQQEYHLK